jgi:hypothetical protein
MQSAYQHLNPIHGMVWAEQRIIDDMYRKGDPFVKELFYMQADNVSFRPTILPSKPASYWKPRDIGNINAAITRYRTSTSPDTQKDLILLNALKNIMQPHKEIMEVKHKESGENITSKKEILHNITQQSKQLFTRIGQTERKPCRTLTQLEEKSSEIDQLEADQKFMAGTRNVLEKDINKLEYDYKLMDRALDHGIHRIQQLILDSVKNSRDTYVTECILLTLLWKIANPRKDGEPKQDFVDYFIQLDEIINPHHLVVWLNTDEYTKEDYLTWKKFVAIETIPYEQSILAHIGQKIWESPVPPMITAAGASYILHDGSATNISADCMETAFRYFFNIIMYNPKTHTFDTKQPVHTSVTNFYQKNPCTLHMQASEVCNEWANGLTNIQNVVYMKPHNHAQPARYYEIKSYFPNMLRICNYLLLGNNPTINTLKRTEQLDLICKTVSRDDFILTWDIVDTDVSQETLDACDYITLKFFINDTHSFEWQIKEGHSVIPGIKAM